MHAYAVKNLTEKYQEEIKELERVHKFNIEAEISKLQDSIKTQ